MKKINILSNLLLCVIATILAINTIYLNELTKIIKTNYEPVENTMNTFTEIETPYCQLKYPTEYYNYLDIKIKEESTVYTQTYICTLNNYDIELFTIVFGNENLGINIGYFPQNDKLISFSIVFNDIKRDDTWTDKEWKTISAMQETVNDIIQSIMQIEGYVEI